MHKGTGLDAMEKAGLSESYFSLAIPMGRSIVNKEATVLLTRSPATDNPEINRNILRKMLFSRLKDGTVVWDRKFTELKKKEGKWLIHFENNMTANADLVIGANGGMSAVRKYVTDAEIKDTGTFIIQGEVSQPEIHCKDFFQLCNNNILMLSDNGTTFVANPNNNGALAYSITFKSPEGWDIKRKVDFQQAEDVIAFLLNKYSDWHPCYHQLFRATSFFVGLPTRKIPLLYPWYNHRTFPVTLVGDAAHIMPPFAGEGVNIGLLDALILSDNLTEGNFTTIQSAIKDYEQRMFVYAAKAQLETDTNEGHYPIKCVNRIRVN